MFDLSESLRSAGQRFTRSSLRRRRSDAGRLRLSPVVLRAFRAAVSGDERPSIAAVQRSLAALCRARGLRPPSRASLYNAIRAIPGHRYTASELPLHVRLALYNLGSDAVVPGHQLVFYGLHYGSVDAASYVLGLPWLDLYQAARHRGWRPRSRGLLLAAMRVRGIR